MEKFSLRYLNPQGYAILLAIILLSLFTANEYTSTHWGFQFSAFAMSGGIMYTLNKYLWNIRPYSWLYTVQDFTGRYEGSLTYEFRNDKGEIVTDTLPQVKIIHQNGNDIVINTWTQKKDGSFSSMSTSLEASIVCEKDGTYKVIYNYLNEGSQEQSFPPHYGTEVLKLIKSDSGSKLTGRYYTERQPYQTKGSINLEYKNNNLTHIN